MSKFIYYLDFFKAPLTFTSNGRQNFSTKLGFLTTIPIFCFLLISFILSDLVQKKHPAISSQSIANAGRPYLRFDKSNMTFSIRITDDNSTADLDPSYFSILIYNLVVNNTSHEVINIDKKKTKICDENDFLNPNYFKDYGISKAICTSNNDTFEIGGYWTEPFVSYMRILMVPCKNDSHSNIICKSTEQIKEYLKNRLRNYLLNKKI